MEWALCASVGVVVEVSGPGLHPRFMPDFHYSGEKLLSHSLKEKVLKGEIITS